MVAPSLLAYRCPLMARMSPPLRASNEGLLRPRVARAQGTHWVIPPLLADFFSILLDLPQSHWPVGLAGLMEFLHMAAEGGAEL